MIDLINRLLSPIRSKLNTIIGHGVVTKVANTDKDGTTALQELRLKAYASEEMQGVQRVQEYGLETYPSVGHSSEGDGYPEAVIVSINGNSEQALAICIGDRRYRITDLAEGEVALYTKWNSESGAHNIKMKSGQEIEMNGVSLTINCTTTVNIIAAGGVNLQTTDTALIATDGLITGKSICHYTGAPHQDVCAKMRAEK